MFTRFLPTPAVTAVVAFLTAFALILSSCSASRPAVEEWQPTWQQIVKGIPTESTLREQPPRAICSETLGFLRSNRARLFPTPDLALDHTLGDWFDVAEDAFFECPPNNENVSSFSEAYELLRGFEAEVDSVPDMDRAP